MPDRKRRRVAPPLLVLGALAVAWLLFAAVRSYHVIHRRNLDLALLLAANNGRDDQIGPLLDRGAHIEARMKDWEGTPLTEGISIGSDAPQRLRIAHTLLTRGANPNARDTAGRTPLELTLVLCNLDMVNDLLAHGADPNMPDSNGNTVLKEAMFRSPEIALKLLENGARVDLLPENGRQEMLTLTEGMGGTESERLALFNMLLAKGADLLGRDHEGKTTLIHAVESIQPAMVKALLAHGANVNDRDNGGDTALTRAMAMGVYNREIIKALIDHGADVNDKGANGRWIGALKQAELRNETQIAAWLRQAGAKE